MKHVSSILRAHNLAWQPYSYTYHLGAPVRALLALQIHQALA